MKRILLAAMVLVLGATGAHAQNAEQVERSQNGASCPRCNLFQADFNNRQLKGKNFAGARLRQSDMGLGEFNGSTFAGWGGVCSGTVMVIRPPGATLSTGSGLGMPRGRRTAPAMATRSSIASTSTSPEST